MHLLQVAVAYTTSHVGLTKASSLNWLLKYLNQFYIPFHLHFRAIRLQRLPVTVQR